MHVSYLMPDVHPRKWVSTDVIHKNGGLTHNIINVIQNLEHQYETTTIIAGGNGCSTEETPESVVDAFKTSFDVSKEKSQALIVSSICTHPLCEEVL